MDPQNCQNCKEKFLLHPQSLEILRKMDLPYPTFCPQCNMQRLLLWRNERSLYKRNDSKNGKEIISIFAPEKKYHVYDQKEWWGDDWDPFAYGREYDFERPFFSQFQELMQRVPQAALFNKNGVASDYCNHAEDSKDCYLIFGSIWNEGVLYAKGAIKYKDSVDILFGDKGELNYETINCEECFRLRFSQNCVSCTDSAFLTDCSGCTNCFGCINLRNKSYYIFNEPYSKEAYEAKIRDFYLGDRNTLEEFKKKFLEFSLRYPRKFSHMVNSPGSTGEGLYDCKNSTWCFDVTSEVENCHYIANAGYQLKDSCYGYGVGMAELMYEIVDSGIGASNVAATVAFRNGSGARYAFNCHGSSNVFGVVGIRNSSYVVLNKKYSKEEYELLIPRIKKHMDDMPYVDQKGRVYRYGEFFPAEISPFAYNETVAQEYFPLNKESALSAGYAWRDQDAKDYADSVEPGSLPADIQEASNDILSTIVACGHKGRCEEQCTVGFKIIPQELEFYRKIEIPLPSLCPNCRHYQRLRMRNPLKLWHRSCMCGGGESKGGMYKNQSDHFHGEESCLNEFETSYEPGRKEIIYCERCYQAEVL